MIDSIIELDMAQVMAGGRNTSDITRIPVYLTHSHKMIRLQELNANDLMQLPLNELPKSLRFIYDYSSITTPKRPPTTGENAEDGIIFVLFNNSYSTISYGT